MAQLPLLVFPAAIKKTPPKGKAIPPSKPHFPDKTGQIARLSLKINDLTGGFFCLNRLFSCKIIAKKNRILL